MPKIHIDEVVPKRSVYPVIINFQNGYPTEEKSIDCVLAANKITGEKAVLTEIGGLLYTGVEEKQDLGKTFILARNKLTGKVRLIEAGLADLKPVLKINTEKSTELDTSFLELSRKFGSKKHKKKMEQLEKLRVNVNTVTEQMHNVTVNITEDQLDLSSYMNTDTDDFYIPPINRAAERVDEVYDLYKILSKEEYENIYAEIAGKNYMQEVPEWIKTTIGSRQLSNEHTVLVIYTCALLKLYTLMVKDIMKKNFVICPLSSILNSIIMKNFTTLVNGRRTRSIQFKDKAFCHSLAFLLLLNNYKFDLETISKNTKYTLKTLITKFKLLRATIVSSGTNKMAHLKLPLPTVYSGRRKSAKF